MRRRGSALTWVLCAVFLAGAVYLLTGAVQQGTATRRASAGEGRLGTFVAEERRCSKTCSWHGTFTADGQSRIADRGIELRGADEDSIEQGRRIPVLNVGPFVQSAGGPLEWGSTIANAIGTFFCGGLALALAASALWNSTSR